MKLEITGKNVDIGSALPQYVSGELEGVIKKYFTEVTAVRVVLEKFQDIFNAKIHIHVNKIIDIDAHAEAGDAYSAFELALEHASKRLRRKKRQHVDKHREHHHNE